MKREGYLATLSIITVLLLGELDNSGSDFGLTKPLWIGAVSWIVWLISHYAILASIILCIVTALSALTTGTPSHVVPPTVFAGIGTVFYLLNNALEDIMTWFNFERVSILVDGKKVGIGYGTIPEEYRTIYYLCNVVPWILFLGAIVPYSVSIHRRHLREKVDFERRGIKYADAEQAGLRVEAEGLPAPSLPLMSAMRSGRHGSALPGLYRPI